MPKKIPEPTCTMTVTWSPTKTRIEMRLTKWIVRAQQPSATGTSWVTIAEVDTPEAALTLASQMADGGEFVSTGLTTTRRQPL